VRELVGVVELIEIHDTASIKQEALLFDRIAALRFSSTVSMMRELVHPRMDDYFDTLEWLFNEGIIFEPEQIALDEDASANHDYKQFLTLPQEYAASIRNLADEVEQGIVEPEGELIPVDVSPLFLALQHNVRLHSVLLRDKKGIDAYPIIHRNLQSTENPQATKGDIIQIALNSLPIPDESTPWEQVIEYRSDPDSQSKFLALRHWMSEVARAELTPAEVEEKLEYLIDQYQQHMKLHRMKTNVGALETIVTTSLEVISDLLTIKWNKAAEALFSLKRRQVALLEGELTAPGSEVAYIVKARETFADE
jgi:hypothetical protein